MIRYALHSTVQIAVLLLGRDDVADPVEVGLVALLDGGRDDLGHVVRVVLPHELGEGRHGLRPRLS